MLDYDPTTALRHWPTPMARFGLNLYGENRYRIIFAPTRRIVAGRPPEIPFRSVPAYRVRLGADPLNPGLCIPVWVLEVWYPPERFAATKRQWDAGNAFTLGPYPERGEYDLAHVFSPVLPDDCNLEKLISWIEAGKTKSFQDNLDACKAEYDQETKVRRGTVEAIVRNAYPAFGATAIASSRVARSTKNPRIIRTAEEVGLPTGHNKFMQLRRPNGNTRTAPPNHR